MSDFELYLKGISRPRIYVRGPMAKAPYTGPRAACLLAKKLWAVGWHPIVPHTTSIFEVATGPLDPSSPDGCNGWLEYDFSMMSDAQATVQVTSEGMDKVASSGTDRESLVAYMAHIKILTEEEALRGPEACGVRCR